MATTEKGKVIFEADVAKMVEQLQRIFDGYVLIGPDSA